MPGPTTRLPGALVLAALGAASAMLWLAGPATAHPLGCSFPKRQLPAGDERRVYAIPHGCVRLAIPADETQLPTVVVMQHNARGRVVTRSFPVPATNLDRANGAIGICGRDSYFFFVAYPYVSVVAQVLYDLGDGRRECVAELARSLLWTGHISRLPSFTMTWFTHSPTR